MKQRQGASGGEGRRRLGGRQARRALRQATDRPQASPAKPGNVGGRFKPLGEADLEAIHRAALDILGRIGMAEVPRIVVDRALAQGCNLNDKGRLCFPNAFVEDVIVDAARDFTLHGRDAKHDFEITGARVRFGTGGAAVRTLDIETGGYRPSTLVDLYDFARLVDRLENVSWFTRCVVATDIEDPFELDVNTAYAAASGTTKPIGTSFTLGENVAPIVQMFDLMAGGEGRFRRRPFCKAHISPVVSPLRYGADAVDATRACVDLNLPINAIVAAQSGATAPATPAGVLAQTTAETLAGLILVNLFKRGHPVIFSNWPFVIDLRTGGFSGGGAEIALMNAGAAQISNFYDLPSGVAASMADSKVPDIQAGYEKAINALATGLAGGNMIYEAAGMFASLLGASFEGCVIDNEMLGAIHRVIRGIEVNEETLGLGVIEEVVNGPGHFLGHAHTIAAMERDYLYPKIGDRQAPEAWEEGGGQDMWARARDIARAILDEHFPDTVSQAADMEIRERFPVRLARERMRPR